MNKIFDFLMLSEIPYRAIVQRLGYPNESIVLPEQKNQIESLIQTALKNWEPKAIVRDDPVIRMTQETIVCQSIIISSKDAALKLKDSSFVSFIAVTAGPKILEIKNNLMKSNQMSDAVVLDAVLSEMTDALADEVQKQIQREAGLKGYRLSFRYSPGYGDLPLDFQKHLMKFLEAWKIGISLSPSFLMVPEKSVSAMIGWIKK